MSVWHCTRCPEVRLPTRPPSGCCDCGWRLWLTTNYSRDVAQQVMQELAPACERIVIAGSIRRGVPRVHDLDFLAIPKTVATGQQDMFTGEKLDQRSLLDELLADRETAGQLHRRKWGPRLKSFYWGPALIPVELYIVRPPNTWGPMLIIRTGPAAFAHELVQPTELPHGQRFKDGQVIRPDGSPRVTDTEEETFKAIGLPYIPPAQRSVEGLQMMRASARAFKPRTDGVKQRGFNFDTDSQ